MPYDKCPRLKDVIASYAAAPYLEYLVLTSEPRWRYDAPYIYARRNSSGDQGLDSTTGRSIGRYANPQQYIPSQPAAWPRGPQRMRRCTQVSGMESQPINRMSRFAKIRFYRSSGTWQDSGGFQLVSLSKFTKITEEGALFSSPFNGEPTMLTVRWQHFDRQVAYLILPSRKRASRYNIRLAQILSCN